MKLTYKDFELIKQSDQISLLQTYQNNAHIYRDIDHLPSSVRFSFAVIFFGVGVVMEMAFDKFHVHSAFMLIPIFFILLWAYDVHAILLYIVQLKFDELSLK